MTPLLSLEEIKMHFWARAGLWRRALVRAVDGVSLTIAQGETLALVGESGCGKTTLGRVSLRLIRPTAGRVLFAGRDITPLSETQLKGFRRQAQAILQDPYSSLDPNMSVYEILEEPLLIHRWGGPKERREQVYRALTEVQLSPPQGFATKYPHLLSGGQRQRVAIARALILAPQFVLADEPVSMIDASSRAETLYLLGELQERHGMSFLYITHDIATAGHFSHRLGVMYAGVIVEEGPTGEVIAQPLHPYTRALIAAVPRPDPAKRLQERPVLRGEPPSPTAIPQGCRFHPRCPHAFEPCPLKEPPLQATWPRHRVACYLFM